MKKKSVLILFLCLVVGIFGWFLLNQDYKYVSIKELNKIYEAKDILSIKQGTITCWLKFVPDIPRRDHLILQTDDSRVAFFLDTFGPNPKKQITRLGARAGGNRRIVDLDIPRANTNFPEATIFIDNSNEPIIDFPSQKKAWYAVSRYPENEYHLVAMSWKGYPRGEVKIFLDGKLMAKKRYDRRYDDGRQLFTMFSAGYRPSDWIGEIVRLPDNTATEWRPTTEMSLEAGGLKIQDLRIYEKAINKRALLKIMKKR